MKAWMKGKLSISFPFIPVPVLLSQRLPLASSLLAPVTVPRLTK